MERYLISEMTVNKYFSQPLYLDDKYILLAAETPITDQLIQRLAKWDYSSVHSHGTQVDGLAADPGTPGNTAFGLEVELKEQQEFGKAFKAYQGYVNATEDLFAEYLNKGIISLNNLTELIRSIMETVKSQKNYILRTTEMTLEDKDYLVVHSTRTCIYALALGQFYKLPNHKLIELGQAAILHEIGMIKLPSQLYMSNKILTPQERRAVSAHPVLGFRIIKTTNLPVSVGLAVLECREHVDGTGYPRNLTGEKISSTAKIIGICSTFAALTSPRPYRRAIDGYASMLELLKGKGKRYDDNVLKAFISLMSVYPLGSWVQVANGACGMVVQSVEDRPKEPWVRIIIAPNGERLTDALVVQTDTAEYKIVRPLATPQVNELKKKHNLGATP